MRYDISDPAFHGIAAQWMRSLPDEIVRDLAAVFQLSPGYYPTTLVAIWKDEIECRGIDGSLPRRVPEPTDEARLPVSHSCDYDWRFTAGTALDLLGRAIEQTGPGDTIAHIGTPTTFALGAGSDQSRSHILLERNIAVIEALSAVPFANGSRILRLDLNNEAPPFLGATAAILDPPWYVDDTLRFLAASSIACAEGAAIFLCQPSMATRPGIDEDRRRLFAELPRLGLILRNLHPGLPRYVTPHFEAVSLRRTLGEITIPADWRTGDLFVLAKSTAVLRYPLSAAVDERWREVAFGPVRIKLRRVESTEDLGPIIDGDVLDNVSRRDPRRHAIGLWTSGNRVYTLRSASALAELIELCHQDLACGRFTLQAALGHARRLKLDEPAALRLFNLLSVELSEHCPRGEGRHGE